MTDNILNIILGMSESGMKPEKIAKELSIDCSTTYRFLKQSGTKKNKKRGGRPPLWATRAVIIFPSFLLKFTKGRIFDIFGSL